MYIEEGPVGKKKKEKNQKYLVKQGICHIT